MSVWTPPGRLADLATVTLAVMALGLWLGVLPETREVFTVGAVATLVLAAAVFPLMYRDLEEWVVERTVDHPGEDAEEWRPW